ncbi:hypothetical protein [Cobetia marina]|uniref:ParE family toxin-like protein n=1 Tax=Cobetia marina TaxID=28258 RepID=UPI0038575683
MPTIDTILARCPHEVSRCYQSKAIQIDHAMANGTPYRSLGGKRLRCRKGYLRFKIGNAWRLLYQLTANGYEPCALISRQSFDREMKRRRDIKFCNPPSQESCS